MFSLGRSVVRCSSLCMSTTNCSPIADTCVRLVAILRRTRWRANGLVGRPIGVETRPLHRGATRHPDLRDTPLLRGSGDAPHCAPEARWTMVLRPGREESCLLRGSVLGNGYIHHPAVSGIPNARHKMKIRGGYLTPALLGSRNWATLTQPLPCRRTPTLNTRMKIGSAYYY